MFSLCISALIAGFFIIHFRLYSLIVSNRRLPVLMYHRIDKNCNEDLCVTPENLERQLAFLASKGYSAIFFDEMSSKKRQKIIISFDDGYYDNFEFLPQLLQKYGLKATIFIPTKFISDGYGQHKMMSFEQLRQLDRNIIEVALHSHSHKNFNEISVEEAAADLLENISTLDSESVSYSKVLAYPYGKFPKDAEKKRILFRQLENIGIQYACRIGNKINILPLKNRFEICRIDIKNSDDLLKFKLKLLLGRLRIF